jgi:hypothetical protein
MYKNQLFLFREFVIKIINFEKIIDFLSFSSSCKNLFGL